MSILPQPVHPLRLLLRSLVVHVAQHVVGDVGVGREVLLQLLPTALELVSPVEVDQVGVDRVRKSRRRAPPLALHVHVTHQGLRVQEEIRGEGAALVEEDLPDDLGDLLRQTVALPRGRELRDGLPNLPARRHMPAAAAGA